MDHSSLNVYRNLVLTLYCMKMRWRMLTVKYTYDDSEESANLRHKEMLSNTQSFINAIIPAGHNEGGDKGVGVFIKTTQDIPQLACGELHFSLPQSIP